MKWENIRDRLPADGQEVLIRQRSIVQLAVYVEEKNAFMLKDGALVPVKTETLQWLELASV
jgi:hypothetical protein